MSLCGLECSRCDLEWEQEAGLREPGEGKEGKSVEPRHGTCM